MLTEEEVKQIAKLARLGLSEAEIKKFAAQLTDILDYVDILNELDTEKVKPTFQVTGLENVERGDKVDSFCEKEELLQASPLEIKDDQIKVKSVF